MSRIQIRGVIVGPEYDDPWMEPYIANGLLTPESKTLREIAAATDGVDLYINSPGGSVFSAYEIANAVKDRCAALGKPASVTIGSMAASAAALFPIMSGLGTVRAHSNAKLMYHSASMATWGGPGAHADSQKLLNDINAETKAVLVGKYKMDPDTVTEWFSEGRMGWLTAEEAKSFGIVHEIIGEDAPVLKFSAVDSAAFKSHGLDVAALCPEMIEQEVPGASVTPPAATGGAVVVQPVAVAVEPPAKPVTRADVDAAYDEGKLAGVAEGTAAGRNEVAASLLAQVPCVLTWGATKYTGTRSDVKAELRPAAAGSEPTAPAAPVQPAAKPVTRADVDAAYDEGKLAGVAEGTAAARAEVTAKLAAAEEKARVVAAKAEADAKEAADAIAALTAAQIAAKAALDKVTAEFAAATEEAKKGAAASADIHAKEVAALHAKLAKLTPALAFVPQEGAESDYQTAIATLEAGGMAHNEAVLEARRKFPALHAAFVRRANPKPQQDK